MCYFPKVNTLGKLVHQCMNHKPLELVLLFIPFILFFFKKVNVHVYTVQRTSDIFRKINIFPVTLQYC